MNVTEAVNTRRSVRAFLDTPVSGEVLREAVALAARSASGGNLQPWRLYVLGGDTLTDLKARMQKRLATGPTSDPTEYEIYPPDLWEPHRTERYAVGEEMYALLGTPRTDKAGRMRQFARNFQFFDAPAALFCYVDRRMGRPQWSDLGMYLQTLMLLLRERGLDSCPQECWSVYPKTIAEFLQPPEELMLFCGMAIGYADPDAPVNSLRTRRLPLDQFATFRGI
ncbi:nitroreductase [Panacagrimonas perspica]|uniref:Nitroreductase n=1 Tax=Panacagrimonas perspica TaxID=381431 RepID=A0A4S3KAI9_9GAMM|nr:nitroreductase [Panacagrimonas perspica]TDU32426.1 nitroreductase [Panacagrimonas perspica]THD05347.1 NADH dehydrogenase [Panacagrimonas perspica]